jgi:hypothetical protein
MVRRSRCEAYLNDNIMDLSKGFSFDEKRSFQVEEA